MAEWESSMFISLVTSCYSATNAVPCELGGNVTQRHDIWQPQPFPHGIDSNLTTRFVRLSGSLVARVPLGQGCAGVDLPKLSGGRFLRHANQELSSGGGAQIHVRISYTIDPQAP